MSEFYMAEEEWDYDIHVPFQEVTHKTGVEVVKLIRETTTRHEQLTLMNSE